MRVDSLKSDTEGWGSCKECRRKQVEWGIFLAESSILLCVDCLRTLRARIDALSILVITGEDTMELKPAEDKQT